MRLETPGGAVVRLTYGAERGGPPAVGFDRSALDPALVAWPRRRRRRPARRGGRRRSTPDAGRLGPRRSRSADGPDARGCRVVVGADGAALDRRASRGRGPADAAAAAGRPRATTSPIRGRTTTPRDARMRVVRRRLHRDRAGARRPGEHRDRARSVVARPRSPGTARAPRSRARSWPPCRRPPTTRARGASASRCDQIAGACAARRARHAPRRPRLVPRRRRGRVPRPVHRRGPAPRARLGRAGGRPRSVRPRRPARAGRRRRGLRPGDAPAVRGEGRRLVAGPGVPRAPGAVRIRRAAARRPTRRPCDDGPRDGRPRPGRRAGSTRGSSPRCSRRDGGPSRGPRRASPAYAVCRDDEGPDPAVPHRAVGRGRRRLDAARRRPRVRRAAGGRGPARAGPRRPATSASSRASSASATASVRDVDGGGPAARDPHPVPRSGSSAASCATSPTAPPTRAAGSSRRRRAGLRLGELARHALGPRSRRRGHAEAGPRPMHSEIAIRHRRPARPGLRPGPRRRALGRPPAPLRPVAGGRAARRTAARRRLRRAPAAHRRSSGSGCR